MSTPEISLERILSRLEEHLANADFKGFDPFDALNSPLIRALTFGNRFLGIAAVQLFKRSPVNLRPIFRVRSGINPKGWGLLLAAYVEKYRRFGQQEDLDRARFFADWLCRHPSPCYSGACWGYNFDWPNRDAWIPAGTPTSVNTAYIGEALLDYAELTGDKRSLECALSCAPFLLKDLHRIEANGSFCFTYTPLDRRPIHNANMLGAALLARIFTHTEDREVKSAAMTAMRYSLDHQREDGAWWYGETPRNRWIDSYHTGYSLLALKRFNSIFPDQCNTDALRTGFTFYLDHFFLPEGHVKYYHDRVYPWEAHAAAHAVLALHELQALAPERVAPLRTCVLDRTIADFWDDARGCFIHQVTASFRNRIDYIRWVQCWMMFALGRVVQEEG